jgi:hypothetical protein
MKKILTLFIYLSLLSCTATKKNIFTSLALDRSLYSSKFQLHKDTNYYQIILRNKSLGALVYGYLIASEYKIYAHIDTLKAIEELLKFEGDERLCVLEVSKYNPRTSNYWFEKNKDYSLQLEALYLINQIAMEEPFTYSPIPALKDQTTGEKATLGGEIISRAFKSYKKWFEVVKKQGLQKTLSEHYQPLDNSGISWY